MKKNDLLKNENRIVRILNLRDDEALIIDINPLKMPFWTKIIELNGLKNASEVDLAAEFGELSSKAKNIMWSRMNMIAPLIPLVGDMRRRPAEIHRIASENHISEQTVRHYLMLYAR